jgi:hypothetical protein
MGELDSVQNSVLPDSMRIAAWQWLENRRCSQCVTSIPMCTIPNVQQMLCSSALPARGCAAIVGQSSCTEESAACSEGTWSNGLL